MPTRLKEAAALLAADGTDHRRLISHVLKKAGAGLVSVALNRIGDQFIERGDALRAWRNTKTRWDFQRGCA